MPETVVLKLCRSCNEKKQRSEYTPYKRAADGLYYDCKKCERERNRKRFRVNRTYKPSPTRVKTDLDRMKDRANDAVRFAIRSGKLKRPKKCERCLVDCIPQGHHHKGYQPKYKLDVIWLCRPCHSFIHRKD